MQMRGSEADWRPWSNAILVPEEDRNRWADRMLGPRVDYTQSGDSIVFSIPGSDGMVEQFDCLLRRERRVVVEPKK
jgi:hypothetical protein